MKKDALIIFDTTLRDGEQSPGASMTSEEKLRLALLLEQLNVDVIEAGFANASEDDFRAIQNIAKQIKNCTVCSLARALESDIERAGEALKGAASGRIHTFIATSPIHMQYKLKMSPQQVLARAVAAVKYAKRYTSDIEFSLEDAGRSEFSFMCEVIQQVIAAGATTINIPDTVGYRMPMEISSLITRLIDNIQESDKVVFSIHCHNDLGMAVANSLAAVMAGARQVECTINGIGERAGNAALEEIVMAVKTRSDLYPVCTHVSTKNIVPTSKWVSSITGMGVQPNKAIVGANAFAHESGIHQDGVIKHRQTYEIMQAEQVGWHENKIVLGKHSGRSAVKNRLAKLGFHIDGEKMVEFFARFKSLADKKHVIYDEDLLLLWSGTDASKHGYYQLKDMQIICQLNDVPKVRITLTAGHKTETMESSGDGIVDAVFQTIRQLAKSEARLLFYSVNATTEGTDSQGGVLVRLGVGKRIVNGTGTDTDIITASAKAYINALNILQQSNDALTKAGMAP